LSASTASSGATRRARQGDGTSDEVYCLEKKWHNAELYPDRLEKDEFDRHATRFVAVDHAGCVVACMRLAHSVGDRLPLHQHFDVSVAHDASEMSRLVVAAAFRGTGLRLTLGFGRLAYREALARGSTEVYCVIEPFLVEALTAIGFPIICVEPPRPLYDSENGLYMFRRHEIVPRFRSLGTAAAVALADAWCKPWDGLVSLDPMVDHAA
jgi:hypothetical protein